MNEMRLIVDEPASGSWNMAVDEAILRSADEATPPTLRFYRWQEPTLSLGYFQKYEDRNNHAPSIDCPCVRRASGGGAIMHDQELTYSFVAAVKDSRAEQFTRWFDLFHETLIEVLSGFGVRATLHGAATAKPASEPFLCFQRRHEVDVVLDGFKICGSAQRRHQSAILQHGSILLSQSAAAPELPGIEQLSGRKIACDELIASWIELLKNKLELTPIIGTLKNEQESARAIESDRFGCEDWTRKR